MYNFGWRFVEYKRNQLLINDYVGLDRLSDAYKPIARQ
jgi:hypothetical protein